MNGVQAGVTVTVCPHCGATRTGYQTTIDQHVTYNPAGLARRWTHCELCGWSSREEYDYEGHRFSPPEFRNNRA